MKDLRIAMIAAVLSCAVTLEAAAQMLGPGMPMPGSSPQGGAFGAPPQGGTPPCISEFIPLRTEAQKRAEVINAAAKRKVSRQELCQAFRRFAEAEGKVVKFLQEKTASCGIPPNAAPEMKANHDKTLKIRDQVCAAGPMGAEGGPPKPTGPGLSEALGTARPPIESSSGRGTFDTLSGNALR